MKQLKKFLSASKINAVLFILMVSMILSATVGAAYAALSYFGETYGSRVEMYDIGVTLQENGDKVSWRDYGSEQAGTWTEHDGILFTNMLREGEKLVYGKSYNEQLNVFNSGTINTYVRVSISRYWIKPDEFDEKGNPLKLLELSPDMIDLHLVNLGSAWLEDESARTNERTVLYYNRLLHSGAETPLFADTLTISGKVATKKDTITQPDGTKQVIYTYEGAQFCLQINVDVVQENNAQDAILHVWGRQVIIDPDAGTLSLQ